MLTLLLTALVTIYLLGPDLASRFILGFVCPSKVIVQSKSEEFSRGIAWALIPLLVAVWSAKHLGHLSGCAGATEWKTLFSGLNSSTAFDRMLKDNSFFNAASAVWWWNVCVLWRLYLIVFVFWIVVDVLITKFGRIRRRGKTNLFARFTTYFLELFVIPRVSDWHLYLSSMLTEYKDVQVHADILAGDLLYRGRVARKELASDGTLASITLESPERFQRDHYQKAIEAAQDVSSVDRNAFWRSIPGKMFVVLGKDISSINLRHSSSSALAKDQEIIDKLRMLLKEHDQQTNLAS